MIETPTDVTCNATISNTTEKVTGKCDWKYPGDLSLVAYFNLQIFLDDEEMANVWVSNDSNQAGFTLQSSDQSANYKAVVYAIDHCNTWSPRQMPMGSMTVKQGNSRLHKLFFFWERAA